VTPLKAVAGGQAPTLEYLRVWKCTAYVLKMKEGKEQISYFTGYDTNDTIDWEIDLPVSDIFVTTVHVLFDKRSSQNRYDYFAS
jgi:hypothetical protein